MRVSPSSTLEDVDVDFIETGTSRRPVGQAAVDGMAESIERVGLLNAICVQYFADRPGHDGTDDSYSLVLGGHRLAAVKKLGWKTVPCRVFNATVSAALIRMMEISENLHRAELTAIDRAEQIEEWRNLVSFEKVGEVPPPGGRQPKELGVRQAARDLGVDKKEVYQAKKIAALSDDAKAAARETGLDNNRSAMLEAAQLPIEQQAGRLVEIAERKATSQIDGDIKVDAAKEIASFLAEVCPAERWDWLKSLLFTAGAKNIASELVNYVGASSVMDRSWS